MCLLPFMASQVSVSKARRLRAAAVTRNLYVKARATVPADHTLQSLVQMVADIHSLLCWSCRGVVSSPEVWAESAMPVDGGGDICGTVPIEPGLGKVGVDMEAGLCDGNVEWKCDDDDALHSGSKNVWCSGCWEKLPDVCGCVAPRWCIHCAAELARWSAEPAHDYDAVARDGGVEDSVSDIHVDGMASLVIIDGADDVSKDESDQGSDSGLEVDAEEIDTMVRRARKLGCSCEEVANAENFNDIGLEQKQELLLRLWPQIRNYSE